MTKISGHCINISSHFSTRLNFFQTLQRNLRKIVSGTEYWDAKEKRIRFVPIEEEPGFEVTVNPESMIITSGVIMDVDLASGSDMTVVSEVPVLSNMTVKQLGEYADELSIEIPSDVKEKEDIIELLS